ncbi:helix-turn-helix domain-containing protein [Shewanella algidipiscicola]|uniref:Transcriptional regulator of eicosapentaenoic acid synthesis PfaR n=1 Tax=Shewanella algidipiscicola TaxID=614070 RepID=A0ABQ4P563_9GAMM|nr:helix-turn-helix domain-containing protein [Shewanella algidipiscicola]GIU42657.1 transcriptional regulator of eicosapentaenoic acid synthesis PfaR [Shewanella algidipiscicola]
MVEPLSANAYVNSDKPDDCTQNVTELRHKNATTTPEMRRFIQESDLPVSQLAKVLNISEATVRKWRKRDSVNNTPNTPHHLNTTLTPMQEYVVVGLRYQLKMPLDRLLEVTQQFINPNVSRSGLARCLKRYGVSRVSDIESPNVPERYFNQLPIAQDSHIATYTLNPETLANTLALPKADGDTVVQVASLTIPPQLTDSTPSSVLLGIDPHSDWIYLDLYQDGNTQATRRYIAHVLQHGPFHLRKLLVRNYHTFLQRFPGATMTHIAPVADTHNKTPDIQAATGDS